MSFDNRIQHFAELIALLKTEEGYAPNETNLKIPALEAYLEELRAKNTNAATAETTARTQRAARNETLYSDTDGLLTRVKLIKNYLKSILDDDSPQYRQIIALQFREP